MAKKALRRAWTPAELKTLKALAKRRHTPEASLKP
jgi:hypothetical protein